MINFVNFLDILRFALLPWNLDHLIFHSSEDYQISEISHKKDAHQELVLHQGVGNGTFLWDCLVLELGNVEQVAKEVKNDFDQHDRANERCQKLTEWLLHVVAQFLDHSLLSLVVEHVEKENDVQNDERGVDNVGSLRDGGVHKHRLNRDVVGHCTVWESCVENDQNDLHLVFELVHSVSSRNTSDIDTKLC